MRRTFPPQSLYGLAIQASFPPAGTLVGLRTTGETTTKRTNDLPRTNTHNNHLFMSFSSYEGTTSGETPTFSQHQQTPHHLTLVCVWLDGHTKRTRLISLGMRNSFKIPRRFPPRGPNSWMSRTCVQVSREVDTLSNRRSHNFQYLEMGDYTHIHTRTCGDQTWTPPKTHTHAHATFRYLHSTGFSWSMRMRMGPPKKTEPFYRRTVTPYPR